jgi:endonuclease/exonuclease/phosphatase family metal-dependent hydrolase
MTSEPTTPQSDAPRKRRHWPFPAVNIVLLLAVWLLNVSRVGLDVEGSATGATPPATWYGTLRVMSLNMLHGFPRFDNLDERLELIKQAIVESGADIVCLQEVPWTLRRGNAAARLARASGMNYAYVRANGNRGAILFEEGEAVLSRYPLVDASHLQLEPKAGLFEHRVGLRVTVETPSGNVQVVVTHLTHGDEQVNAQQAASLRRFVAQSVDAPVVVAGDLNATPESPQIAALSSVWIDAWDEIHPDEDGNTCCVQDLTAAGETLTRRIDYLFLVPNGAALDVADVQRVLDRASASGDEWQWASDHVGLLTVLRLGAHAAAAQP